MTRDVAPRLGFHKPALMHSKFFPALQGAQSKMSASVTTSAIFLTDTEKTIEDKIQKHAFSGGQITKADQEKLGANLDVDVAYQYLTFFLDDDAQLADIAHQYKSGKMMTSQVKRILINTLIKLVKQHQVARSAVTEDIVTAFLTPRKLQV